MIILSRKKYDEIENRLQQVLTQNQKLQEEIDQLKKAIEHKEALLVESRKKYKIIDGICLSEEQSAVVDMLNNTDKCYFVTGKAGTGKSTVLKYFMANTGKKVVALAPTGIAANAIKGRTIHSFFGLRTGFQDAGDKDIVNRKINADSKLIEELDSIIIDEASMIRADVMDMIDRKLQAARNNKKPYGGIQIILFGDLFQLPPVVTKIGNEAEILMRKYSTPFFFGAPAAKQFIVCGLQEIFRQKDDRFIKVLNDIRFGRATKAVLDELYALCGKNTADTGNDMYIVPTNDQADQINEERLSLIKSEEYTYYGFSDGDATEADVPVSGKITLKVGAPVMLLCNDTDGNFVNGTLAEVVELDHDVIRVCIDGKRIISVDKHTWEKYDYVYNEEEDKVETKQSGSFTQYPLKLAYAITVHKSQGQTLDHITIDYKKAGAFAPGQTYVALSRCRKPENIHLTVPIQAQDIQVSQEVIAYMRKNHKPALQCVQEQ